MAAFLSLTHKMAAWEFSLQDGGICESFTQKMAAWEICLQNGGNAKQTKCKQKQRRIYLTFAFSEGHVTASRSAGVTL